MPVHKPTTICRFLLLAASAASTAAGASSLLKTRSLGEFSAEYDVDFGYLTHRWYCSDGTPELFNFGCPGGGEAKVISMFDDGGSAIECSEHPQLGPSHVRCERPGWGGFYHTNFKFTCSGSSESEVTGEAFVEALTLECGTFEANIEDYDDDLDWFRRNFESPFSGSRYVTLSGSSVYVTPGSEDELCPAGEWEYGFSCEKGCGDGVECPDGDLGPCSDGTTRFLALPAVHMVSGAPPPQSIVPTQFPSSAPKYSPGACATEWTEQIRDETQQEKECGDPNAMVAGFQCQNSYCDDMRLLCKSCDSCDYPPAERDSYWSDGFSEEEPPQICEVDYFLTGLACAGDYCDILYMQCTHVGGRATGEKCAWTEWMSEEGTGILAFPEHGYARGIECAGSYCDLKRFYLCSAVDNAGSCPLY